MLRNVPETCWSSRFDPLGVPHRWTTKGLCSRDEQSHPRESHSSLAVRDCWWRVVGDAVASSTALRVLAQEAGAGPIRWSLTGVSDLVSLDPAKASDQQGFTVIAMLYGGLVKLDESLLVVPSLAEEWSVSDDSLVYTFTLRDGIAFSDGTPITADDVVWTFNHALDPKTGGWTGPYYPTAQETTETGDVDGPPYRAPSADSGRPDHVPFVYPMPIWDYWPWLIIPLAAGVSIVYKSVKCQSMNLVPKEALQIFVMILVGMALLGRGDAGGVVKIVVER